MAFIRRRLSSWNENELHYRYSYQLIETYRENGKVKQRILANLGNAPTIADALERDKGQLQGLKTRMKTNPYIRLLDREYVQHLIGVVTGLEARIAELERVQGSLKKCTETVGFDTTPKPRGNFHI
jgi:hypothetical protein